MCLVWSQDTFGTCVGRVKAGAMCFARYSTDDRRGIVRGYTGTGRFTDDPLETFGGAGVAEIPQLQKLLKYICREGFEHHVAANFSDVSKAIHESARYLGWATTTPLSKTRFTTNRGAPSKLCLGGARLGFRTDSCLPRLEQGHTGPDFRIGNCTSLRSL